MGGESLSAKRAFDLLKWFLEVLAEREGRTSEEIQPAALAFLTWFSKHPSQPEYPGLTAAWECWTSSDLSRQESFGPLHSIMFEFPPAASPVWERRDAMLVVGAVIAFGAAELLRAGTKSQMDHGACLLADAQEAKFTWLLEFDLGMCRHASPLDIRITDMVKRFAADPYVTEALSKRGRKGAKKAHELREQKRAPQWTAAFKLWTEWQNGKHPGIRTCEDFARRVQSQSPDLTSFQGILTKERSWRKKAASEQKSRYELPPASR
jgi:hypothetical protein